ncbi:SDR family oxidoreductase [Marinobacterium lutimaris]|uniref:Short-chain dehydrogenase n=1 Tax=Marinobacterium lutimaris TaxID=568106 RepID=A0A1H6AJR3_9GAMM|nr:SDR family oxidoreductase [Marinobacterium lutimaris]SEG47986.1 Short-chain dehydrogenase [Marinobacterium lutimaris]
MQFRDRHILITGASSGIGAALAILLARRGASLLLHGRNQKALDEMAAKCMEQGCPRVVTCSADFSEEAGRKRLLDCVSTSFSKLDMLINNAGIGCFSLFDEQSPELIDRLISTNVTAPILLTRALLPMLTAKTEPRILNIGSAFGAIGYPGYTTYCATKGAMRMFSESLAREYADTSLKVQYLAPRATRTAINTDRANQMLAATGGKSDTPATVAEAAIRLLESDKAQAAIGWPEKLLVRLNGLRPELINAALKRQLHKIKPYARSTDQETGSQTPRHQESRLDKRPLKERSLSEKGA